MPHLTTDFDTFFNPRDPDQWQTLSSEQFMRHTAHELLNELTGLRVYIDLLRAALEKDPQADTVIFASMTRKDMLERLSHHCNRMTSAMQTQHAFARNRTQAQESGNPADSVSARANAPREV